MSENRTEWEIAIEHGQSLRRQRDAERALADDAAKVLVMPPGPRRIEAEEWWLARYREARGL